MNRKAQMAILIIAGIIIVAVIAVLFYFKGSAIIEPFLGKKLTPQATIEDCARKSAREALELMVPQGGFIEPTDYKMYNDTKVVYICKNEGNFKPCISQHPMLLNEIARELESNITPIIDGCYYSLKKGLEGDGYSVDLSSEMKLNVSFAPDKVSINIERDLTLSKESETQTFGEMNIELKDSIYNLASIANQIAHNEAKFCSFEYVGYANMHPRFLIKKFALSDSTKIYSIKDKNNGEEMNIAIRGCVVPPGV